MIDYDDLRKADSPDGLIRLLKVLGHEPESSWEEIADLRDVLLDQKQPASVRDTIAESALTIRSISSLSGDEKGIECYVAILRPGLKLTAANCRNISHAFRDISDVTRIDETFIFIGVLPEEHTGDVVSDTTVREWATVHLARVYRRAGLAEEIRLSRLDWKPTRKSRHALDCLSALNVSAYPGQVKDEEVVRFQGKVREWFNKEQLSRRFFREFYKRFENALDLIQRYANTIDYEQFEPGKNKPVTSYTKKDRETDPNREEAAKFLMKQVLRLLFLHFLQEKEWLCRDRYFLLNQWRQYEHSTRSIPNYDATEATGFHEQVLIPLFFETLNQLRPDDASDNWGPTKWDKGERALMPYLNGGIFDIDKVVDHWDFEANEPMVLIPDAVFSGDRDYDPELDDESLTGRQVNFLAFLDDYHFTIAEDTPVDEAVALDPELMGKIFENLLVSRHSDGAYYTPRSIVRFQCKDTLARYLEEQLTDIGLDHDWFIGLFDLDRDFSGNHVWEDDRFTPIVADRIENALAECKVLDPAVGSGAYLLGMLTEMLRLRQLCHMIRTGHMVDRGSIEFYHWKTEIIRDSLYGVDINPQAVVICHLRLWLAMVVDQDRSSASPLPNLDFQVTAGDSIRDSINGHRIFVAPGQTGQSTLWAHIDGADDEGPSEAPILARIKRIRELRHAYYNENAAPSERDVTRAELQTLRQEMMLEGLDQLERYEIKQTKGERMNEIKREKFRKDIIAKFHETRQRIEEGTFTSIFSYEAIFGDVFQREKRKGFDITIGNPPYLEDEGIGGYDDIQQLLRLKSNNLYAMFWIRAIRDLTRPGGQVSFITSDTFLTIRSHQETRKAILTESTLHYAIQSGNWFFTFNNAWTAILTVTKRFETITEKQAWDDDLQIISYDITKLPARDLSALEKALELWKPTEFSRARTANIDGELTDIGDETSWYLELDSGYKAYIGRYCYPLGLPWRNENIPIFSACPKLFKLTWDKGPWKPKPKINIDEYTKSSGSWKDHVPMTTLDFNGHELSLVKLREIAELKSGLSTADDNYYLRKIPGARGSMLEINFEQVVPDSELLILHNDDKIRRDIVNNGIPKNMFGGRYFVPFSKPPKQSENAVNMFWCPVEYYIDWSESSITQLKTFTIADVRKRQNPSFRSTNNSLNKIASRFQNPSFYFLDCINVSVAGENAPQFWVAWGGVPGHKGSVINPKYHNSKEIIGMISSHLFTMLCKFTRGSMSGMELDAISNSPLPITFNVDVSKIEAIIESKKNGNILTRKNNLWNELSKEIMSQYFLDTNDIEEVIRWNIARYSRPGLIE